MTKRALIDEITQLNASARPAFLAEFEVAELGAYLQRLRRVEALTAASPLTGDPIEPPSDKPIRERQLQPYLF